MSRYRKILCFSKCFLSLAGSIWEVISKFTSDVWEIWMPGCRCLLCCFKMIFGKGSHTLHPASVINVLSHLEFLTWPKLCPVNWFHSSKCSAKSTMKTFQCFILSHQQLNFYSVLENPSTRDCPQAKSHLIKVRQRLDAFWGFINGIQVCPHPS